MSAGAGTGVQQRPETGVGVKQRHETGAGIEQRREADARQCALRLLSHRARSRAELTQRLTDRGFAAEEIEPLLDRYEDIGLLDDREYAQAVIRSATARGLGLGRVVSDLRRRGISAELIAELSESADGDQQREIAIRAARGKLRSCAALDPAVRDRRLLAFLARRGFPLEMCRSVVRELCSKDPADWPPAD